MASGTKASAGKTPLKVSSEPEPQQQPAADAIKIIIADSQAIYRVGTKKIFALEDDIRVVAQAETLGQLLAAAQKFPNDVILIEAAITTNPRKASLSSSSAFRRER